MTRRPASATAAPSRCTSTRDDLADALRRDVRDGPHRHAQAPAAEVVLRRARLAAVRRHHPARRSTTRPGARREILEREAAAIAARTGATTLLELGSGTSDQDQAAARRAAPAPAPSSASCPFDVCEPILREPPARAGRARTRACGSTPWWATSSATSAGCRWRAPRSSPSSAAPSATSRPPAGPSSSPSWPTRWRPGDWLLLGTDLVKDPARLVAAYDDAAGVTAEFNRNVLHVLNRELDGDFAPDALRPRGPLGPRASSGSRCTCGPRATSTPASAALDLEVDFADGELLHTEISAKFTRGRIEARAGGRRPRARPAPHRRGRRLRRHPRPASG